jgi:hypothetical protein
MKDTSRKDVGIQSAKWKNAGVNGSEDTGMGDAKMDVKKHRGITENSAEIPNLKKSNARKRDSRNRLSDWKPEEDPRFHDTYKFLRRYRDATYSLKVVVHQMETQFRMKYGTSVDEFLDSIYAAGADLSGDDIEERAKSIERSNRMLKMLDSSVDLLRFNHKHGEQYYWILYYTFLSPQKLNGTNEIIEKLRPHISNISYRTYYRKRHKAIESLSTILWGYTAKETIEILNEFFPEE